jgi:hypothetical protein
LNAHNICTATIFQVRSTNAPFWHACKIPRLKLPQTRSKFKQLLKVFGSLVIAHIRTPRSIGQFGLTAAVSCAFHEGLVWAVIELCGMLRA